MPVRHWKPSNTYVYWVDCLHPDGRERRETVRAKSPSLAIGKAFTSFKKAYDVAPLWSGNVRIKGTTGG